MSFQESVQKLSRTTAVFWAAFLVAGALGFMVSQNIQLRRQVKALEAGKAVHIVNSIQLNPLEVKAMMEEVLQKAAVTAPAAARQGIKAEPKVSIEGFCQMKANGLVAASAAPGMASITAKAHYNRPLDRCFVDISGVHTDEYKREWVVRALYDGGNNKKYGELLQRVGEGYSSYCAVYPGGDQAAALKCHTEAAYSRVIAKYMEN